MDELRDINKNLLEFIYGSKAIKEINNYFFNGKRFKQAQSGTGNRSNRFICSIDISKTNTGDGFITNKKLSKQSYDNNTNRMFMKGLKTHLLIQGTEIDSDIDVLKICIL